MGYKSIVGALSGTSSIVKYSDDEKAWQIYTRWKNGKPKFAFKRKPDTIPYSDVIAYTTFVQTDEKNKGGYAAAGVGGLLFGPVGIVGGAILGRKTVETIKQLGFAIRTKGGDEYIIPLLYKPMGVQSDKIEAKTALGQLQKASAILDRNGTELLDDWQTDIDAWRN
ncbi:MAG: hypothetical protein LKI34_02895 [Bifidobacterium tibiigranuli]|jgi:hypothetical protein|uniref:hypothetical protein n=1 Tax=Bifidobacterium tibiigranuli TaxID=2172043 RepID=UPI0026EB9015|nr:hypothetical protein [Bifidobacterium tibiigranuli]MCI1673154.1 hypothetical protein [Bifidobacterium tibiigranuli]MCI1713601.1 hypothetical protein [Bifidobacterium tibiigranuli]